uniref:NADH-ubiquinone oxidoreductase chain 2 n=1 Tax=Nectonemertes cf. mirabilis HC-2011 TaxID=992350 RepID=I1SR51_9BILA|nr:NADH dehydrogenase subunit 2 [Nectonemertes cf. mirabilis HC-2011]ADZ05371.1 NADH dehydrogenase subunit 2 [Nectonemertes cf. mirabilis HC-2011]
MLFPFFYFMVFFVVFGSFMSLSSFSWLSIWMGMELNLMCFLPIIVCGTGLQSVESAVKYFLVQVCGSSIFIFSGIFLFSFWFIKFSDFFLVIFIFSFLIKLGVFPFHWWFPAVMGGLSWFGCFFLSTWQKVIPLLLLLHFCSFSSFYFFFGSLSSVVGGFGGLNQANVRFLISYSSINHLGWIICLGAFSFSFSIMYFLVYVFFSSFLFFFFWCLDFSRFSSFFFLNFFFFLFFFFIGIFSMAGIPPFLGFFVKMLCLFQIGGSGGFIVILFLILGSLTSLYFYLALFFSFFFFSMSFGGGSFSFKNLSFFLMFMFFFLSLVGMLFFDFFFCLLF